MKGIGAFNDYWTGRENLFLSFIIHLRAREDSIRKIFPTHNAFYYLVDKSLIVDISPRKSKAFWSPERKRKEKVIHSHNVYI